MLRHECRSGSGVALARMPQLIEHLTARGIDAERKGLYRDIETLREFGMDIRTLKRQPVQYALARKSQVSFRYYKYNADKKRIARKGGAAHVVTPLNLTYSDGNYYLVACNPRQRCGNTRARSTARQLRQLARRNSQQVQKVKPRPLLAAFYCTRLPRVPARESRSRRRENRR